MSYFLSSFSLRATKFTVAGLSPWSFLAMLWDFQHERDKESIRVDLDLKDAFNVLFAAV